MKKIGDRYTNNIFENIKHIDEYENEYWYARELQKVLEYKDWRNFQKVIDKAVLAANNSVSSEVDWIVEINKPIKTGKGKEEIIKDYKLSRYICYLIVQNADPSKEVVALGQTYFAIQTRKQEITEQEYDSLSDDEKRFYQRKLTNDDIFERKKLRYREDILDNMNEDELVANLFRINQTKQKLLKDNVQGEKEAKDVHYEVGKKVRHAIADIGGMMPEEMPTPKKSLKELERKI